jgi:DNA polymerase-3 subunit delta'
MSVTGDTFADMAEKTIRLIKRSGDMQVCEIVEAVRELAEEKKNIDPFFDVLTIWFRDVLLYKATKETEGLVFRWEISEIKREAALCSYEGLGDITEAIGKAGARLRANVNFDLAIELLFLTIRDNLKE